MTVTIQPFPLCFSLSLSPLCLLLFLLLMVIACAVPRPYSTPPPYFSLSPSLLCLFLLLLVSACAVPRPTCGCHKGRKQVLAGTLAAGRGTPAALGRDVALRVLHDEMQLTTLALSLNAKSSDAWAHRYVGPAPAETLFVSPVIATVDGSVYVHSQLVRAQLR